MSSKPRGAAIRASTRTKPTAVNAAPATTRTTRAASKTEHAAQSAPKAKKMTAASRKPLLNRANSVDARSAEGGAHTHQLPEKFVIPKSATPIPLPMDTEREPIQAFLRIRPQLGEGGPSLEPYLEPISDTVVRMGDPYSSPRSRMSSVNPASMYTFSHIFPPDTTQSDFFNNTTLPLVRDVLEGQNGLLFTYGVTNSGKTYTIQGGSSEGNAGILPRTLDVIFNSIEGLHGDDRFRPVRLQGIELASEFSSIEPTAFHIPSSSPALADILEDSSSADADTDPTVLKLDRNHEYTIWLSYAEVYNEKVYDLFASVDAPGSTPALGPSGIPRPTSSFLALPVPSSQANPLLLTRKALPLKSCPPSDYGAPAGDGGTGKYVAGLRQIRVQSATQAKALLRLGQLHRRVFGTLANSQSSRSHALVTIKVLRVHCGERDDPTSIQTSRLTLVDLAGSERTKHTHTSGDRLREAGSINKSLMVLGQCLETLRANQRTVARSLAAAGTRVDTREVKKGLAIVPFRHSKLTEVLMDYFVGDGKAVMIVNVNPYDTGFDENSHVMRFAALAREVCTAPATTIPRVVPTGSRDRPELLRARNTDVGPHRRKVTISTGGPGRKVSEAILEVLEEDEEPGESDDRDDGPIDPLVDALFDEIESLRAQLYDAQVQCALAEANTREEVMEEMEERMRSMEKMYKRRLMNEVLQNERKMDAKLDMLQQTTFHNAPPRRHDFDEDDFDEIESPSDPAEEEDDEIETSLREDVREAESDVSRSPSPLVRVAKTKGKKSAVHTSANSDIESVRTMDPASQQSQAYFASQEDFDDASSSEYMTSDVLESLPKRPVNKSVAKVAQVALRMPPSPIFEADVKAGRAKPRLNKQPTRSSSSDLALVQDMDELSLLDKADDSTIIIPDKKARKQAVANGGPGVEYVPKPGEADAFKKKKRQLGKHRTVADDELEAMVTEKPQRQLRRSVRH
ncbi:P-loop containing nucleoside triphosphate hydrolase protein [Sparassis latifolia]